MSPTGFLEHATDRGERWHRQNGSGPARVALFSSNYIVIRFRARIAHMGNLDHDAF